MFEKTDDGAYFSQIALNYEGSDPRVGVLRGTYVDARRVIHTLGLIQCCLWYVLLSKLELALLETKLDYDPEEICVLADIREPFSEEQGRPRWPSRENIVNSMATSPCNFIINFILCSIRR